MTTEQKPTQPGSESYQETITWLFGLQRFGIKFGLDNMHRMLEAFGNPHHQLRAVHIGGSNGKGSVAAFTTKIYQKAGYRVGLYTSPHLSDFSERIRLNGIPIPTEDVVRLTREIRAKQYEVAQEDGTFGSPTSVAAMTFFEFTTIMAFLYFVQENVDLAVVEVGMGGRLDATNVLQPLVSVITTIGREHEQYLGNRLAQIAREKAGIIKPKGILLTGITQPAILKQMRERCDELGAVMYRTGKEIRLKKRAPKIFDYHGLSTTYRTLEITVSGEYQPVNAALAVAATEILRANGYPLKETALRAGLKEMKWPARLELVHHDPPVLLDGAHNLQAIRRLRKELETNLQYCRLFLVIGIMQDKAIQPMLRQLVGLGHRAIFTRPQLDRAAPPELLLSYVSDHKAKIEVVEDVKEAVRKAMTWARSDDLVCVAGSLFAAGEARELFFHQVEL